MNLYKPNPCLVRTQKLLPWRFGLDRFHCIVSVFKLKDFFDISIDIRYEVHLSGEFLVVHSNNVMIFWSCNILVYLPFEG